MTTGKRPLVVDAGEETTRRRQRPRVVIIGGGFAGLQAVRALRDVDVDVLLLDRAPYTTFQPLLYQVATGGLNAGDITYALRAFAGRVPTDRAVDPMISAITCYRRSGPRPDHRSDHSTRSSNGSGCSPRYSTHARFTHG